MTALKAGAKATLNVGKQVVATGFIFSQVVAATHGQAPTPSGGTIDNVDYAKTMQMHKDAGRTDLANVAAKAGLARVVAEMNDAAVDAFRKRDEQSDALNRRPRDPETGQHP